IHDLGGMDGFGPVELEPDEPVFHTDWERRALGCTFAGFVNGVANGGQFRHAIERMDPAHYLSTTYYEHWLTGTATRFVEAGRSRRGSRRWRTCSWSAATSPAMPSTSSCATTSRTWAHSTAPRWWLGRGPTPRSASGCWRTARPPSPSSASEGPKATTWSSWRT